MNLSLNTCCSVVLNIIKQTLNLFVFQRNQITKFINCHHLIFFCSKFSLLLIFLVKSGFKIIRKFWKELSNLEKNYDICEGAMKTRSGYMQYFQCIQPSVPACSTFQRTNVTGSLEQRTLTPFHHPLFVIHICLCKLGLKKRKL